MAVAGDAYFCCHESEDDGQLDLKRSGNGLIVETKRGAVHPWDRKNKRNAQKGVRNQTIPNPFVVNL
ncbi:hypothetical protein D0469_14875 [Peribacillus saganii]|uniref:Uncharacterized protein n=1 Tax=Peribacillus saganii TaxID=2303992 RepID=A0A372LL56_9BACI|nr:hypothetical protein [Peribacillus saganii]RFU67527.1 hypothetical protein D0469_14875 [Peribacillus saganii]